MSKFSGEFATHPDAKELFVVNGMPFLEKESAQNFQRGTDHKLEVVKRPAKSKNTEGSKKLGVDAIKAVLTARNVEFDGSAKKAELVKLLEASNAKIEAKEE